jgi:uncharacterized membrane protein YfcA
VEQNILVFILIGFIAQMIDGALGMAYGVSSNAFLLSIGGNVSGSVILTGDNNKVNKH